MIFVLKNPCQQQSIFTVAPCQPSYACPIAQRLQTTVFHANRIDRISPQNPCQQLYFSVHRVLPTGLSPSYFPRFPFRPPCRHSRIAPSHRSSPQAISHGFPSVHPVVTPVSLLPTGALHKLFHMVSLPSTLSSIQYRSFPPHLSPSYFPRFPFRPPCRHSRIAPSHRSSPQAISHGFPSRPPCRHSRIAHSHRSSPRAISHGFPSVHPLVASVSLLPTGAPPKLFHTVSLPSIPLSFQYYKSTVGL